MKFGKSNKENLRKFGIYSNDFSLDLEKELTGLINDHPVFFYIIDSQMFNEPGSMANGVHHNIIVPVLTKLKGLMKYIMYDC